MIYLIYGTKNYFIDKCVKDISKDFEDINISKFDLDNTNLNDVIDDCMTISMFADRKLVICENASIFSPTGKTSVELENYLNNPNSLTTLVFVLNSDKVDKRKKITKLIKEKGEIKEFCDNENPSTFVKRSLKDYQIDNSVVNLLIDRVGDNILTLESEINKIKLYKDDKVITKDDIFKLTSKAAYDDIFKLIDYIINDNKDKALETLNEMLKNGEEVIKIIIILANQIRLLYQAKTLQTKGFSEKSIAETLKVHPYRIKLALQNGRKYSSESLLNNLKALADIDFGIKSGKLNKDLALEMYILSQNENKF